MGSENADGEAKSGRRGRKPFIATDQHRATVVRMLSEGADRLRVAEAIGVSMPTLRKAFADELASTTVGGLFGMQAAPPAHAPPRLAPERRSKGGRKSYVPGERDRRQVALLVAIGTGMAEIAAVVGVTEPTLRRHFAVEIATGAAKKRAENLLRLEAAAAKGNVAAQKTLHDMFERASLEAIDREVRTRRQDRTDRPETEKAVGKKVMAHREAIETMTADAEWAQLLHRH